MTNGLHAPPQEHIVHVEMSGDAGVDPNAQSQKLKANIDLALVGRTHDLLSALIDWLSTPAPPAPPPETAAQKLAAERANQDIQSANDSARAAIQAVILINGGAATAILAYLSKDTHTAPSLLHAASWSLGVYAIGVFCGVMSMWCQTQALAQFGYRSEAKLDGDNAGAQHFLNTGQRWLYGHWAWLVLSVLSFIGSSGWMASEFSRAVP
jgi:hypothetical protein